MLKIDNLNFYYEKKQILNSINLYINKSEFHVLLGLNGAGKSTLFSLITRLLKLNEGNININSHSIKNDATPLKDVGIVFQEPTLDLDLTVKQNLYYYGALKGLSFNETLQSIDKQIISLELEDYLNTPARSLNGGHRRRVEILRALINKPKLLLFDEPTVGLDLKSRFAILNYIRSLVQEENISVLWITHLFDEVKMEDNISFIKKGDIIEKGIVREIVEQHKKENLVETFNYLVG